jgi:hypothetical protein
VWSAINPNDRTSPILMPSTSYKKGLASTPKCDEEPHKSEMSTVAEPVVNGDELPVRSVSLDSDPEKGPSQVVRRVIRKNRSILLVRSNSDSAASPASESDNSSGKRLLSEMRQHLT